MSTHTSNFVASIALLKQAKKQLQRSNALHSSEHTCAAISSIDKRLAELTVVQNA